MTLALILSTIFNVSLLWQSGRDRFQIESLTDQIEHAKETRRANEEAIYLQDPHGLVARGIVSLGEIVSIHETYTLVGLDRSRITRYVYRIEGYPSMKSEAQNKQIDLPVTEGETVYLTTYRKAGQPQEVVYYVCYTNSTQCVAKEVHTSILTGN